MERDTMKVAGLGFRNSATLADLRAALALTGCPHPDALATLATKAKTPPMQQLAAALDIPVIALSEQEITGVQTATTSARIKAHFGTGSLAEAAALVAARLGENGSQAQLICARVKTADGLATAAIAQRITP